MNSQMPVLFLGHGSPMNALQENAFTQSLAALGQRLPRPDAILAISAHWNTSGTWLTHMTQPKTIHDFYGFPEELFKIDYPAPGQPRLAEEIKSILMPATDAHLDTSHWGLDHGTWSMLVHIYPDASIPVVQLSIDMTIPNEQHFALGQKLKILRKKNVLILGSGNIVHNLRKVTWHQPKNILPWASQFDAQVKKQILQRDYNPLLGEILKSPDGQLSVPSLDHYIPLLYILGASDDSDSVSFPFEGFELGSISLRSVLLMAA
jgi:4,5-DOPA dioxygenase extradiol